MQKETEIIREQRNIEKQREDRAKAEIKKRETWENRQKQRETEKTEINRQKATKQK
jgi:hypothetical protein